jgi:ribonuclease HII
MVVVFDGGTRHGNIRCPCVAMPKADVLVPVVAAASVCAKVSRDTAMKLMAQQYPYFGFARNVGYGTREHREALANHGLCPEHRRTYEPMRWLVKKGVD